MATTDSSDGFPRELWSRCGPATVRLKVPDAEVANLLGLALSDVLDEPAPVEADPTIVISVAQTESGYRVDHPRGSSTHSSVPALIDGVIGVLNATTLRHSARHAHLHAGGVTIDGRAVVYAAPSGAGKTTLTASLVRAGFGYLSDERIGIDADGVAHPYHKPLSIKRASWPLLPELEPAGADGEHRIWQVPASRISPADGADALAGAAQPALIVQIRHEPGETPRFEPLSRAEMVGAMILNSMDFDVIGPETIVWFGRATAAARTGMLVTGSLPETVDLVRTLVAETVEVGGEPEVLPIAMGAGPHDSLAADVAGSDVPGLRAGSTVVRIDDEVLIHEPATRQAIVLNPSAGAIVAAIDGCRTWTELGGVAATSDESTMALATDLGVRGLLAGVARSAEPPDWQDLTRAAKEPPKPPPPS